MTDHDGAVTHAGDDDRTRSDGATAVTERGPEPPTPAGSTSAETESAVDEPAGDEEAAQPAPLSLDVIFDVLKNERRRRVLAHLEARDEPMELGPLAETIAAEENDTTVDAITSQERKRVYVGLYQCHLPKMADPDIVRYDRRRGLVELADNAEHLVPYLNAGPSPRRRWYRYYAAIAAGGTALLAASVGGLLPDTAVPLTLAAVLAALVGCSLLHAVIEGVADN